MSEIDISIDVVEYHTAGEPFRIVRSGHDPIPGDTILEKRRYAQKHLDRLRTLVVYEPRGHADMYGCFVTEPEDDGADLGVLFFHNEGFSTACGHGTIALVTWALEHGVVDAKEPESEVIVDVPSGRLTTVAKVADGEVTSVRFRNVPSFVEARNMEVRVHGRPVPVDISYGGAFYASVRASDVGLSVEPRHLTELIRYGRLIKSEIESHRDVVHPLEPDLRGIYGVIFFDELEPPGPELCQQNVAIFADGEVDRSPCGSGTSARLALLDDSGELARGRELLHYSIIGSRFRATVVGDDEVGDIPAVITEVEGRAHPVGTHTFLLRSSDELGTGFILR